MFISLNQVGVLQAFGFEMTFSLWVGSRGQLAFYIPFLEENYVYSKGGKTLAAPSGQENLNNLRS